MMKLRELLFVSTAFMLFANTAAIANAENGTRGKSGGGTEGGRASYNISNEIISNITALGTSIGNQTLILEFNLTLTAQDVPRLLELLNQTASGVNGGTEADFTQARVIQDAIIANGTANEDDDGNEGKSRRRTPSRAVGIGNGQFDTGSDDVDGKQKGGSGSSNDGSNGQRQSNAGSNGRQGSRPVSRSSTGGRRRGR